MKEIIFILSWATRVISRKLVKITRKNWFIWNDSLFPFLRFTDLRKKIKTKKSQDIKSCLSESEGLTFECERFIAEKINKFQKKKLPVKTWYHETKWRNERWVNNLAGETSQLICTHNNTDFMKLPVLKQSLWLLFPTFIFCPDREKPLDYWKYWIL